MELKEKTIRKLLQENKASLVSLKRDINILKETLGPGAEFIDGYQKTLHRDIQDRWESIAATNKQIEELWEKSEDT